MSISARSPSLESSSVGCPPHDVSDLMAATAAADRAGEAAPRRAAEHRAARGARARARGQLHPRSQPAPPRRATRFPRFEDNVRVLRGAYRTLADDVRTGQFVVSAAEWLLDNFHLVTAEISRYPPESAAHLLPRRCPTLASREHAGHARIYAIAVELIRHSDSRLDRQQLIQFLNSYQRVAPLTIGELWAWPSMLKLALIENLRRLADEMLRARATRAARPTRYVSRADSAARRLTRCRRASDTGVRRAAAASRARVRPAAVGDSRRPWTSDLAAQHTTAEDAIRGEHQRQGVGAGLGGQRHHQPAPVRDARLAGVRRGGQPGRTGAAARSGRRVSADGLSQPRSRSARPSRNWPTPSGEGAGARGAARRSKARARRRPAARTAIARPTSAITSSTAAAAISKPISPIARRADSARGASLFAPCIGRSTSAPSRS